MSEERIERDFMNRDEQERRAFLEQTWCDKCLQENLGMKEPAEYEYKGIVFIEGKCNQCGEIVLTELTDEEF
ncbi:hypothetical protein [Aliamphritea ceti]|uniref:hypothetical protein n=1 Tax=Aliamphritea ceti TaxID=1524258 RepID=UPI0021C315AF|nr:hypothetical protein [Aliamphritea ceti]